MIYITHPFEDQSEQLEHEREKWGKFLSNRIMQIMPEQPLINFPLNWILTRKELNLTTTPEETLHQALTWIGKADGAIMFDFPGRELCERCKAERAAILRLDIPFALFPFVRTRFDQQ